MDIIEKAIAFEKEKRKRLTTSDRIRISREAKNLILEINELYKKSEDEKLMDMMKRLTVIKQKVEKRLKGRPLSA